MIESKPGTNQDTSAAQAQNVATSWKGIYCFPTLQSRGPDMPASHVGHMIGRYAIDAVMMSDRWKIVMKHLFEPGAHTCALFQHTLCF